MLRPVLVVVALVVVAMAGLRLGWVRVGGLTGSCTQVAQNADGTVLEACVRGRLAGWPSLAGHGCTVVGQSARLQDWSCPVTVVASQVGR